MNKKNIFLAFGILLIVIVAVAILILNFFSDEQRSDSFLSSLKGEIVFTRRDGLYLNIYKINADGTGEKMLYHHENKVNSNASFPFWSENGSEIYFAAMKDREWVKFVMDADGKNVRATEEKDPYQISRESREKDIIVKEGSIYILNKKGEEILIRLHKDYDFYLNPGPEECSWSPDKYNN
ncbi:MAG: hypothetical protein Athens071412_715 [Parcubacteria group bacterium Athens0714_12]|nr:MAG: hypothetical protein Athens071412_715 [Parcubacteria group bacterium Athens0714_12]